MRKLVLILVLALSPLVRAGIEERVDASLNAAARGERGPALELGTELISADKGDWRGWYLRFLALDRKALSGTEKEALEAIRPVERREEIRGLLGYLNLPQASRILLARELVERYPSSALAHSLHASSLLTHGETEQAARVARTALRLDPALVLAARVEAYTLDSSAEPDSTRACELLRGFPHDSVVVQKMLAHCPPVDDARLGFEYFGSLLETHRGRAAAAIALSRLLAIEGEIPTELLLRIVRTLEVWDESWWIYAPGLISRFDQTPATLEDEVILDFLIELWGAARYSTTPLRSEIIEQGSLALARSWERQGRTTEAHDVLEATLEDLSTFRRQGHLELLARIGRSEGHLEQAERYELDRHLLAHPFALPPADAFTTIAVSRELVEARTLALFPSIESTPLLDVEGGETLLPAVHSRPRLFVFWNAHCAWVELEAERIRALAADPSSVLRRHEVEVIWINTESAGHHERARERIAEIGLEPKQVYFQSDAVRPALHERLGVVGSPWLFLVVPSGQAVFEVPHFRPNGWAAEMDEILDALDSWVENDKLVADGS